MKYFVNLVCITMICFSCQQLHGQNFTGANSGLSSLLISSQPIRTLPSVVVREEIQKNDSIDVKYIILLKNDNLIKHIEKDTAVVANSKKVKNFIATIDKKISFNGNPDIRTKIKYYVKQETFLEILDEKDIGYLDNGQILIQETRADDVLNPIATSVDPANGRVALSAQTSFNHSGISYLFGIGGSLDAASGLVNFVDEGKISNDGQVNAVFGLGNFDPDYNELKKKSNSKNINNNIQNYFLGYVSGGLAFSSVDNFLPDPTDITSMTTLENVYFVGEGGVNLRHFARNSEKFKFDVLIGAAVEVGRTDNSAGLESLVLRTNLTGNGVEENTLEEVETVFTGTFEISNYARHSFDVLLVPTRLRNIGLYGNIGAATIYGRQLFTSERQVTYSANLGFVLMRLPKNSRIFDPQFGIILGWRDVTQLDNYSFGVTLNFGFGRGNVGSLSGQSNKAQS